MFRFRAPPLSMPIFVAWLAAGAGLCALSATPAQATRLYMELGGGVSQIRTSESFFGTTTPTVLSLGTAFSLALAADLTPSGSPMAFHLGAMHRLITGSSSSMSYAMQATYPFLRVEIKGLFATFGATPFVWRRADAAPGLNSFKRPDSSIAMMTEVGYNWPITPAVSFSVSTTVQTVLKDNSFSPRPALDGVASLRFYLGSNSPAFSAETHKFGEGGMGTYEGFRYPYGFSQ